MIQLTYGAKPRDGQFVITKHGLPTDETYPNFAEAIREAGKRNAAQMPERAPTRRQQARRERREAVTGKAY